MQSPEYSPTRSRRPGNGRFRSNRKVSTLPISHAHDDDATKPQGGLCTQKKNKPKKRKQQRKGNKTNTNRARQADIGPNEMAKYVALDCEMVGVGEGGVRSALARVCIVNWSGDVIFDTYVTVNEQVTDYRTFVSGVREEDLQCDSAMDFASCRERVASLLRGKILVGHALKNDLQALGIQHPWHDTRDTAKYEPFMKTRFDDGVLWPRKLKDLAEEKLGIQIQVDGKEHSPIEDANTALELYKFARTKWEKVIDYKVKRTREILQQQDQAAACA